MQGVGENQCAEAVLEAQLFRFRGIWGSQQGKFIYAKFYLNITYITICKHFPQG
jgi:hypothetical protein